MLIIPPFPAILKGGKLKGVLKSTKIAWVRENIEHKSGFVFPSGNWGKKNETSVDKINKTEQANLAFI